ncbi:Cytidylyltransferase [Novymonas esmeraldas]|uniref:Cytidylyltransferase n=1 Tax=Novymonas esmeraldas TaxID=1808958 RepID=A0AAW0ET69_9TRYP
MALAPAAAYELRTEKLRRLADCLSTAPDASSASAVQPVVLAVCGSFNPIHAAHLKLFDAAKAAVDGVDGRVVLGGFLSPVSDAYGKPGLRRAADRVRIAEEALRHHPGLSVDTWECQQPTYTRTLFVLQALEEHVAAWYATSEPAVVRTLAAHGRRVRVVLVCGADLFSSFWIPRCWPLSLLQRLLDEFALVVVHRDDAHGDVRGADDFARVCRTAPLLTETAEDGATLTIDMSQYTFTFASFAVPDDTSSTAVRAAVADLLRVAPGDEVARAAVESRLRVMLPADAVQCVVDVYGR